MCHAVKEGGREGDKELQREGACAAACACFVTENTTHEDNLKPHTSEMFISNRRRLSDVVISLLIAILKVTSSWATMAQKGRLYNLTNIDQTFSSFLCCILTPVYPGTLYI